MLKRFWKKEDGSVTVMVALTMTVLLGFSALVVDYGYLTNEKSLVQNAADSAALAGVVLGEEAAIEYVMKNTEGVETGDIVVETPTADTMKVTISKDAKAFFSKVLTGEDSNRVVATATAQYTKHIPNPGYAVWAEDTISLKNKAKVDGVLHSNNPDGFDFSDDKVEFSPGSGKHSEWEPMPDYSFLLSSGLVPLDVEEKGGTIELTSDIMNSLDPDAIYYSESTAKVVIKKHTPLKINLIANGPIEFLGSGGNVDAKILYTTHSDGVTLNGSSGTLRVVVYAPNGDVRWNGSSSELSGAIIAKNFVENGSKAVVAYNEEVVGSFARLMAQLIK